MKNFNYTTIFSSQIKALVPEEKDRYLALAGLMNIGDYIPDINTEANIDLLPIAFNAFVVNRVNKNGDVIDTETAVAVYKHFLNKPINIEHNRDKVIGTILTAGFSEFGTDKVLSLEQVKDTVGPFNVTLGGIIWKTVNNDIANFIEESSDPTSESYLKVSASWELGFSDFNIILLNKDDKNIENGEVIADEEQIKELQQHLKAFGGKESVENDKKAYRMITGRVIPLGIGLTETPAADVKGISTNKTFKNNLEEVASENNNISQNEEKHVITRESMTKIESIKDITNESLKEVSASEVSDFIESELKKASEKFLEEKASYEKQLQEAQEKHEILSKEHEDTKLKIASIESSLSTLETEKRERDLQEKFNEHMSTLEEEFDLDDEVRAEVAKEIKDLNEESFSAYLKKMKKMAKGLTKKQEKLPDFIKDKIRDKEEKEAGKCKASEQKEEAIVIQEAVEEAQKEDASEIPNSTAGENETLLQKYRKAFTLDQFDISK